MITHESQQYDNEHHQPLPTWAKVTIVIVAVIVFALMISMGAI